MPDSVVVPEEYKGAFRTVLTQTGELLDGQKDGRPLRATGMAKVGRSPPTNWDSSGRPKLDIPLRRRPQ
jgi:hypothetical protein